MKSTLQYSVGLLLALVATLAQAVAVVDYTALSTAAMTEITAAIAAGVVLFAAIFGIKVGLRVLHKFAR